MQIVSVSIDLGKTTFHLVALGMAGNVLVRKRFTQRQLLTCTATCWIGLEASSGAHFLGRALRKQGHDVRLIAAQFVKAFVKSNKNDFVDAEAIAEVWSARTCASFRCVLCCISFPSVNTCPCPLTICRTRLIREII